MSLPAQPPSGRRPGRNPVARREPKPPSVPPASGPPVRGRNGRPTSRRRPARSGPLGRRRKRGPGPVPASPWRRGATPSSRRCVAARASGTLAEGGWGARREAPRGAPRRAARVSYRHDPARQTERIYELPDGRLIAVRVRPQARRRGFLAQQKTVQPPRVAGFHGLGRLGLRALT